MHPDPFPADLFPALRQRRRIALLIDADNVPHDTLAAVIAALGAHGTAHIRRAYGDWGGATLQKGWKEKLRDCAIRPIQQFSYTPRKNATDIALVIDAMELLHTQRPDAFCLVSSDADFTPLALHLRGHGLDVYGFGERKTPASFVHACTSFVHLEDIGGAPAAAEPRAPDVPGTQAATEAPVAVALAAPKPQSKAEPKLQPKPKPKPKASAGAVMAPQANDALACAALRKTLRQNTKLVHTLREAVLSTADKNGWAAMAAAGKAANRKVSINPRALGVENFVALFEATGLFAIFETPAGPKYLADKRNKTRTPQPVL